MNAIDPVSTYIAAIGAVMLAIAVWRYRQRDYDRDGSKRSHGRAALAALVQTSPVI
ncbi:MULTISPECIES: hypothetical protein [unclassified Mesorhizobium]|nr:MULTISPECIES: hypothetical protein [unclassified Mesorhizobium]UCI27870.1 hypothetical protein FJ430_09850 [Mesorhizobium sp. B2-8-5]